jgi:putative Mg2+ transporter-C (MgtC) family protein
MMKAVDDLGTLLLVLTSAAILGGAVGVERELRHRWAGLRTHMIVSVGCATFVVGGMSLTPGTDAAVARIIQGIAAGIGFIGAGTILKLTARQQIRGLTTASSIWLAAAIGTACGLHYYLLAVVATALTLAILVVLGKVETMIPADKDDGSKQSNDDCQIVNLSSGRERRDGPPSA